MEKVWIEVNGGIGRREHYKLDPIYCPPGRRFFINPYGIDRWKITQAVGAGRGKIFQDLTDRHKNLRLYTSLKKAKQTAKRIADAARLKKAVARVKKANNGKNKTRIKSTQEASAQT